jgi:hypothetical protein
MAAKALSLTPSLTTALANISHYVGEDCLLTCTFAATTSLSGWTTVTLRIRERFNGDVVLTKTAAITDAVNGVFTFTIAAADTTEPATYEYEIQRGDSGSSVVLARGLWQVLP